MAYGGEENKCCVNTPSDTTTVHLHGPSEEVIQPAAVIHSSDATSTSTNWARSTHVSEKKNNSCFFHVLNAPLCTLSNLEMLKRCHEYVHSLFLNSEGLYLTDTILLDARGGGLIKSRATSDYIKRSFNFRYFSFLKMFHLLLSRSFFRTEEAS